MRLRRERNASLFNYAEYTASPHREGAVLRPRPHEGALYYLAYSRSNRRPHYGADIDISFHDRRHGM